MQLYNGNKARVSLMFLRPIRLVPGMRDSIWTAKASNSQQLIDLLSLLLSGVTGHSGGRLCLSEDKNFAFQTHNM